MHPLRRPRLWLGLWCAAIVAVIVLSLIPPPQLATQLPRHADKLEHLFAYATLAFGAVQLFASRTLLGGIGVALIGLGVLLEVAQGTLFPEVRQMDWYDALANTCGVLLGLGSLRTRAATWLSRWDRRRG